MNILFIQETGYYESIGVMYISSFLKTHGHTVDLLIASEEKQLFMKIKKFHPDLIAFTCTTDMSAWVISMAALCKKHGKTLIIAGGPHPTCFPEFIQAPHIDMICQGEGEYAMLALADAFDAKKSYLHIPGIWVKKQHCLYKNPPGYLIQDFSNFPLPDRALYYKYGFIRDMPTKRFLSGRGCPYQCAFCHNQLLKSIFVHKGAYVRKMPIVNMIAELKDVKRKFALQEVHFSDDTFVLQKSWVIDFCRAYKKEIHVPFSCNVRADLLDRELVQVLHASGCQAVSFGLESGNEDVRNMILHKNITNKTVIKAAKLLKSHHIHFLTTNMVGVPEETEENVWDTLRFNRMIKPTFTRCFIFDPFPGLPLTNRAIALGLLPKEYSVKTFHALSHTPILSTVNQTLLQNMSLLFYFLVKIPIPIFVLKRVLRIPFGKSAYILGRAFQAYVEARFFQIPLIPGIRYSLHTLKAFTSN